MEYIKSRLNDIGIKALEESDVLQAVLESVTDLYNIGLVGEDTLDEYISILNKAEEHES